MNFIKLVDIYDQTILVNPNHIVSLEYAITELGETIPDQIIISLSNGEAVTVSRQFVEALIDGKM
jgi:hypothetical protein